MMTSTFVLALVAILLFCVAGLGVHTLIRRRLERTFVLASVGEGAPVPYSQMPARWQLSKARELFDEQEALNADGRSSVPGAWYPTFLGFGANNRPRWGQTADTLSA